MTIRFFQDASPGGGYYEVDIPEGEAAPAWLADKSECAQQTPPANPNSDVLSQIAKLEAQQTPRLLRESIISPATIFNVPTGQTAYERMAELDAQIALLRAQLT